MNRFPVRLINITKCETRDSIGPFRSVSVSFQRILHCFSVLWTEAGHQVTSFEKQCLWLRVNSVLCPSRRESHYISSYWTGPNVMGTRLLLWVFRLLCPRRPYSENKGKCLNFTMFNHIILVLSTFNLLLFIEMVQNTACR